MADVTQESLNSALQQLNDTLGTLKSRIVAFGGNDARLTALEQAVGILTSDHAQLSQQVDQRIGAIEVAAGAMLSDQITAIEAKP